MKLKIFSFLNDKIANGKSVVDLAIDHEEQNRLDELEIKERRIRRDAEFEREKAALQHCSQGNGRGYLPDAVTERQRAILEDCTQNIAARIQGPATPGRTFAPPLGLSGYISPFTATSQPPPFPTVPSLGVQITSSVAPLIAARDNLGNVMSILPPGRERVSLEDEGRA